MSRTFENVMAEVKAIVEQTNSGGVGTPIEWLKVQQRLEERTGKLAAALPRLRYEDLADLNIPVAVVSLIVDEILRSKPQSKGSQLTVGSAQRASPEELVKDFARDPYNPNSLALRHLRRLPRVGDKPVVVFDTEGKVDIEATVLRVDAAVQGKNLPETARGKAGISDAFPLGARPGEMEEIHPLFLDMDPDSAPALNFDGTGQQDGRPWGALPEEVRHLLVFAVRTKEISAQSRKDPHSVAQIFLAAKQGLENLSELYPTAAKKFRDAKRINALPPLRRMRDSNRSRKVPRSGAIEDALA